jgi:hypothetical protein
MCRASQKSDEDGVFSRLLVPGKELRDVVK